MKKLLLTALLGLFVWIVAITFFIFFGEYILFNPGTEKFLISMSLLFIATALLLWAVTSVYTLFNKAKYAAIQFGIIGTIIGLSLDSFALSKYDLFFSNLNEVQVISFTIWMSFAYALYLLIPALISHLKNKEDLER